MWCGDLVSPFGFVSCLGLLSLALEIAAADLDEDGWVYVCMDGWHHLA